MRMCPAQAITLRRMKTDQYNGQVLCQIPAKHTSVVYLPFSTEEAAIYMAYEEKTQVRAAYSILLCLNGLLHVPAATRAQDQEAATHRRVPETALEQWPTMDLGLACITNLP